MKNKGLPTFGTKQEKIERLKKHYGINFLFPPLNIIGIIASSKSNNNLVEEKEIPQIIQPKVQPAPVHDIMSAGANKKPMPKSTVVDEIEKLKQKRDERRLKMENYKKEKADKEAEVQALGKNIDVDFEVMLNKHRYKEKILSPHVSASHLK